MTSDRFNATRALACEEMAYFDRLSPALREAIKSSTRSVRAKTVFDAVIRGVDEATLIATIKGVKDE